MNIPGKKIYGLLAGVILTGRLSAQQIDIPANIVNTHPRIYTDVNDQANLTKKINDAPWAKQVINKLQAELEPYLKATEHDSTYMVSRLQMYWKTHHNQPYIRGNDYVRAEGKAPVPTVRFAGSRDWATVYTGPTIEQIQPYAENEDGSIYVKHNNKWEWADPSKTGFIIEAINTKILTLAQNAAFLYWYTNDERYARFAYPIITTYLQGIYYLNPPKTADVKEANIISGLTSFEVIHEGVIQPTVLCYDFLFPYIKKHSPDFDQRIAGPCFKKWLENYLVKGNPNNNWNIFEARFMIYLAEGLENNHDYPDGKGAGYYLDLIFNKTSVRQSPLIENIKGFDQQTAIWHESSNYALSVSKDLLNIVTIADRIMPGKLQSFEQPLKKAVLATCQYLFPNKTTVAFGDAHHVPLPYQSCENLIALARKHGNEQDEKQFTQLLKLNYGDDYQRRNGSLFELFFYADKLLPVARATLNDFTTNTFYSPNVSWLVERNGTDIDNGLMISANASQGNHSHANGIAMELYGKGYTLAPDFAAGSSYWQKDHLEFNSQFAAHNTVVVDGRSAYKSMEGVHPFKVESLYPASGQAQNYFQQVSFFNLAFTEPETEAAQLRLLSIIRTSANSGYYVDVFRSKRRHGADVKNEYLYHNLGNKVTLNTVSNQQLKLAATNQLSSTIGDIKGYDYFTDKSSVKYEGDFKARFDLEISGRPGVSMNMWMMGSNNREIFSVLSPPSRAVNAQILTKTAAKAKIPTIVVRQQGEAWTHPFVAVYEPAKVNETSIATIKALPAMPGNPEFTGVIVTGKDGSEQYILSDVQGLQTYNVNGLQFVGQYGVYNVKNGKPQYLFLGSGTQIMAHGFGINSQVIQPVVVVWQKGEVRIYADEPFELIMPLAQVNNSAQILTTNKQGEVKTFPAKVERSQVRVDIPSLKNTYITIKLKN